MKHHKWILNLFIIVIMFGLCSCRTIPKNAVAVQSFDKTKYLGKWYEIARLDFKYERGLNNTTAEYSLNEDGSIGVLNKGYDYTKKEWREAIGKAKFVKEEHIGMLKVSFFGPFYSGYNVLAIDEDYQYVLVSGKNLDYLWILSRKTSIPDSIKHDYLKIAEDIGFNTSELIWVTHDRE
ncbi:lipocalin family protein [Plebeiibacterium sediminum]|uniref:Outer membrane lipoprotein Blc n=1 Tax=Plebeiibacterium sediminum TaxID=2992112 RepID=A0AAE3SG92_9BACT|nr:lipocalin family protein [Plebeiobacterium sediminum]MCW3788233.1 lipocalin family protein [Plebeiobacterium sediminum]